MEKKYTLVLKGNRIEVSKEVYRTYYQCRERERYTVKLANENELSLDKFTEDGVSVEYKFAVRQPSIEDMLIHNELLAKLNQCLELLDENEKDLINELFFNRKSESELARETGILQQTINYRKKKILKKLKKYIEKN